MHAYIQVTTNKPSLVCCCASYNFGLYLAFVINIPLMENVENQADASSANEKCRRFEARLGPLRLDLNPVVTLVSSVLIWGFLTWCITDPERTSDYMIRAKKWMTAQFTWFYIGVANVWLIFLLIVYFSDACDKKLGKDDEKPEFSDGTYFTMLFAAGVGIGLFYFGVAEPVLHYEPGKPQRNRFWGRYFFWF